jgi:predicted naringenin-chalcone synthase
MGAKNFARHLNSHSVVSRLQQSAQLLPGNQKHAQNDQRRRGDLARTERLYVLRSKLERGKIKSEEALTNGEMIETRSRLSAV